MDVRDALEETECTSDLRAQSTLLTNFYFASGTGLALMVGHRRSIDFGFFSAKAYNDESLLQRLSHVSDLSVTAKAPMTFHLDIVGVGVAFLGYQYPLLPGEENQNLKRDYGERGRFERHRELDPMPDMLLPIAWDTVKEYF